MKRRLQTALLWAMILCMALLTMLNVGQTHSTASADGQLIFEWKTPVPAITPESTSEVTAEPTPEPTQSISAGAKSGVMMYSNITRRMYEQRIALVPGSSILRSDVTGIRFAGSLDGVQNFDAWDMSQAGDGSVLGWLDDENVLTIAGQGGVIAPEKANGLFAGYDQAQFIDFNDCLFTNDTLDMPSMFYGCRRLTTLDLSGFNTAKVREWKNMFGDTPSLREIAVSDEFIFRTADITAADLSLADSVRIANGDVWMTPARWLSSATLADGLSRSSAGYADTAVRWVQTRLKEMGYLDGNVDGKFGPMTEAALQAFQADSGISKTGAVDTDTFDALNNVLTEGATAPDALLSQSGNAADTPTLSPVERIAATNEPLAAPVSTVEPTEKPTATTAPTATLRVTATPTVKPTATPSITATPTAKPTATPRITATPTPKPTATPRVTTTPTTKPTATLPPVERSTATNAPPASPEPPVVTEAPTPECVDTPEPDDYQQEAPPSLIHGSEGGTPKDDEVDF